jgi:hypothetical protein
VDNEFKDLEDSLKELKPKLTSHGMRWNLAQRLSDLEAAEQKPSRPRLMILSSVAASILVMLAIWIVVSRNTNDGDDERIVEQEPKTEAVDEDVVVHDKPLAPVAGDKGMEFVGDENAYPATIPFEIERHLTAEEDLGIVRIPDQPPMRKVRRDYVRILRVSDPTTGKTYRVQKPESETILIRLEDD